MRCCARCKPFSPRSRSFTDLSATSKRSASTGSAPRRGEAADQAAIDTLDLASCPIRVIAGLDPAIHRLERSAFFRWMPGSSPGMTNSGDKPQGISLRRDAHFGSGRAHVGIDVLLVFDE